MIERKKCKCGCGRWPTLSCFGKNYQCLTPKEREKAGTKMKVAKKNKANRQAQARKLHTDQRKVNQDKINLELWYKAKRYLMRGKCIECGASTNREDDFYYRWSICHVVPKSLVPSVATQMNNWIELCQEHHQEFDNTFDRASKMKCFTEAKRKFDLFKDLIPTEELRKVNPYLLQIKTTEQAAVGQ